MSTSAGSVNVASLVARARDADLPLAEQHAAFARLVEGSQHLAFGLALASLRDVEDARDAAQDAFATAWLRLGQLRDATAFRAWLSAIVATQCARRLRRRRRATPAPPPAPPPATVEADAARLDYQSLVATAVAALPRGERDVVVLFYFLGCTHAEIGRALRLKPGTVGKRLHDARLRIRRGLPRSVRGDFVRLAPSRKFVEDVRRGLFDEYVGEYRFDRRPDLVVTIARHGDTLVAESAGQRNVLLSLATGSLATSFYDGEGRFRRGRNGKVAHFVYYEFGRRMGVARKVARPRGLLPRDVPTASRWAAR